MGKNKFHTGQKVICKKDFSDWEKECVGIRYGTIIFPEKGQIYTVRKEVEGAALLFYEILNKKYNFIGQTIEPSFQKNLFAPLATLKLNWDELTNK